MVGSNGGGEAFRRLGGLESPAVRERYDVVVIGGGQAGLSVGYYLRKRGLRFLILDASERIGDAWRKRWDSLRLFTPAKFDGIAGMKFPAPPNHFPTKDEMADYLESYAARFQLPVRTNSRVERLVYGAPDPKAGWCGTLGNLVQDPRLNHRPAVRGGVLADACGAVLRTFFDARRGDRAPRAPVDLPPGSG